MNRTRILGLILFLAAHTFASQAQSYKTAGGIRMDNGLNLTLKQHIANGWAAEGVLHTSIGSRDLGATLLAEKHHRILFRGINIYYGAGAHYYWQNEPLRQDAPYAEDIYGASFIGGAEISLGRINVSIDWKPELHLNGGGGFDWNGSAISVRYVLAKRERRTLRNWKVWDDLGLNGRERQKSRRPSKRS
ncbi:MAG: hypothetical protein RMJ33_03910 [Saprospiraceae bacterium]|nr:hypothetical protein [Saprospiraceae bacterium]MDW8228966.1 hypothetical protein [Saprospiraceae bacterium]